MTPDPKKYARALKITYSRLLSPEEVKPFLDAHYAGDQEALRVLKDKFQDEGDPRGDIWDRAQGLSGPAVGWEHVTNGGYRKGYPLNLTLEGGVRGGHEIEFSPMLDYPDADKVTHVRVEHRHMGINQDGSDFKGYVNQAATFTPTEARALADKFPAPHSEQIHAFLDQHFPDTKRPTPEAL